MVAQLMPAVSPISRADIISAVQARIEEGAEPNAAFSQVFEDLDARGQLEALARLHGVNLVGDIWRKWNLENRPAAVQGRVAKPVMPVRMTPVLLDDEQRAPASTRFNRPVHSTEGMRERSMLDALYKINGEWVRLGGMDNAACERMFKQYREAAKADEHNARYFKAMAAKLPDGKIVQDVFTDEMLMRLYKTCQP